MKVVHALLQLFFSINIVLNLTALSMVNESLTTNTKQSKLISTGKVITSQNGQWYATMQNDGNFVVYQAAIPYSSGQPEDIPLWETNTRQSGVGPWNLILQTDGTLILKDSKNAQQWTSGTRSMGVPPYRLMMQNDGNLVLWDSTNTNVWATNTVNGTKQNRNYLNKYVLCFLLFLVFLCFISFFCFLCFF